jgi:DNA-binding response OmpR family regulator
VPLVHALIIEDEALIAFMLEELLRDHGFRYFDIAESEADAVVAARARTPDLIAADERIKDGSGARAVEQICRGWPIPVIYTVGLVADVEQHVGRRAVILQKPFTAKELATAVEKAQRFEPWISAAALTA